jgi:nitroimidazol reductase NimA-like FMN-containing flavoprotein (pyridoxamine 5'-phosphate oxidase superfamily)
MVPIRPCSPWLVGRRSSQIAATSRRLADTRRRLDVLQPAIEILNDHRMMAISTVRPDGWPQTTIVGYANQGWTVYFAIFRSSQKLANIRKDDRVSIAVSSEPPSLGAIRAVYAGAHASEVTDDAERKLAWRLLTERHPNLADIGPPDASEEALMRATCKYVSVLDYSRGIGHTEAFIVSDDGAAEDSRPGS